MKYDYHDKIYQDKIYQDKTYQDIINLPHPTSTKHPRMSMHDRTAQFSPFAALKGHEEAIEDTADEHNDMFEDRG